MEEKECLPRPKGKSKALLAKVKPIIIEKLALHNFGKYFMNK